MVPFQSRLVQGIEAKPIADIGLFVPRIPLFENSSDSIRAPYLVFRERQRTTRTLVLVGLSASLASGIALLASHAPNTGLVVPVIALDAGLGVGAVFEGTRAESALQTAAERYNSALPTRPY